MKSGENVVVLVRIGSSVIVVRRYGRAVRVRRIVVERKPDKPLDQAEPLRLLRKD